VWYLIRGSLLGIIVFKLINSKKTGRNKKYKITMLCRYPEFAIVYNKQNQRYQNYLQDD
jgi:hypothetical protein